MPETVQPETLQGGRPSGHYTIGEILKPPSGTTPLMLKIWERKGGEVLVSKEELEGREILFGLGLIQAIFKEKLEISIHEGAAKQPPESNYPLGYHYFVESTPGQSGYAEVRISETGDRRHPKTAGCSGDCGHPSSFIPNLGEVFDELTIHLIEHQLQKIYKGYVGVFELLFDRRKEQQLRGEPFRQFNYGDELRRAYRGLSDRQIQKTIATLPPPLPDYLYDFLYSIGAKPFFIIEGGNWARKAGSQTGIVLVGLDEHAGTWRVYDPDKPMDLTSSTSGAPITRLYLIPRGYTFVRRSGFHTGKPATINFQPQDVLKDSSGNMVGERDLRPLLVEEII